MTMPHDVLALSQDEIELIEHLRTGHVPERPGQSLATWALGYIRELETICDNWARTYSELRHAKGVPETDYTLSPPPASRP